MRNLIHLLSILFIIATFSYGEDERSAFREMFPKAEQNVTDELKVDDNSSFDEIDDSTLLDDESFSERTLFPTYLEYPTKIYVNEIVPLHIRIVATKRFTKIKYVAPDGAKIIRYHEKYKQIGENIYETTIYFQPNKVLEELPNIGVELYNYGSLVEEANLPKVPMDILDLGDDDGKFSHVIAKNLQVKKYKTTKFDEENLITVMEMEAQYGNLYDMNISNMLKQGIDSKSGAYPHESMYYFVVFEKGEGDIEFSYFNTISGQFENISVPIVVEKDNLSTQIDLNPKKSKYELYKDALFITLCIVFLVAFFYTRKWIYLIVGLLIALYFVFFRVSMNNIYIKQGAKIRILPTEKSTIFFAIENPIEVEQLNRVKPYIKILLPDGKIGWVKESDIVKN